MKFEKKLIILSGANSAKGTLTLEKNAFGTFAAISIYNLANLNSGEYAIGLKNSQSVFIRKIGSMGRIMLRFEIEQMELDEVHCVIFDTDTESPLMYGTNSVKKLWHANMMDGIKSKKPEFLVSGKENPVESQVDYSPRPPVENRLFMDILPKNSEDYIDTAIAAVNYYPSEMNIEIAYSKRDEEIDFTNPIDKKEKASKNLPWSTYSQENKNKVAASEGINKSEQGKRALENDKQNLQQNASQSKAAAEGAVEKEKANISKEATNKEQEVEKVQKVENAKKTQAEDEVALTQDAVHSDTSILSSLPIDSETVVDAPPLKKDGFVGVAAMEKVFYEQVKEQLDSLIASNPRFEPLEKLMEDTRWAKVDFDGSGKYYAVGLIGQKPDYICYAVPALYTKKPPFELGEYCQWLPLDPAQVEGEGFWLMFQDAGSGDSIIVTL